MHEFAAGGPKKDTRNETEGGRGRGRQGDNSRRSTRKNVERSSAYKKARSACEF